MQVMIIIAVAVAVAAIAAVMVYFTKNMNGAMDRMERRMEADSAAWEQRLENVRETVERRLAFIQRDTGKRLDDIEDVVNKKLHTALDEKLVRSFGAINEQLENMYAGMGEMKNLASDVGDLKKVLANVKTRGIIGEMRLGSIMEEIMPAEQYDENVSVVPGSRQAVEFALKLPSDDGKTLYLPIDSKFPLDAYYALSDAYESGDREKTENAGKMLESRIKGFAKDIASKYICPPYTTDFAVMFLPTEGLYTEAVRRGMIEKLWSAYHVSIAGPSTMAALLQSLEMCFRTIRLEKRSAEVWETLAGVKDEFDKFASGLENVRQRLSQAEDELEKLAGARTRAIQKKLKDL